MQTYRLTLNITVDPDQHSTMLVELFNGLAYAQDRLLDEGQVPTRFELVDSETILDLDATDALRAS